jgi:hypothetical protein
MSGVPASVGDDLGVVVLDRAMSLSAYAVLVDDWLS